MKGEFTLENLLILLNSSSLHITVDFMDISVTYNRDDFSYTVTIVVKSDFANIQELKTYAKNIKGNIFIVQCDDKTSPQVKAWLKKLLSKMSIIGVSLALLKKNPTNNISLAYDKDNKINTITIKKPLVAEQSQLLCVCNDEKKDQNPFQEALNDYKAEDMENIEVCLIDGEYNFVVTGKIISNRAVLSELEEIFNENILQPVCRLVNVRQQQEIKLLTNQIKTIEHADLIRFLFYHLESIYSNQIEKITSSIFKIHCNGTDILMHNNGNYTMLIDIEHVTGMESPLLDLLIQLDPGIITNNKFTFTVQLENTASYGATNLLLDSQLSSLDLFVAFHPILLTYVKSCRHELGKDDIPIEVVLGGNTVVAYIINLLKDESMEKIREYSWFPLVAGAIMNRGISNTSQALLKNAGIKFMVYFYFLFVKYSCNEKLEPVELWIKTLGLNIFDYMHRCVYLEGNYNDKYLLSLMLEIYFYDNNRYLFYKLYCLYKVSFQSCFTDFIRENIPFFAGEQKKYLVFFIINEEICLLSKYDSIYNETYNNLSTDDLVLMILAFLKKANVGQYLVREKNSAEKSSLDNACKLLKHQNAKYLSIKQLSKIFIFFNVGLYQELIERKISSFGEIYINHIPPSPLYDYFMLLRGKELANVIMPIKSSSLSGYGDFRMYAWWFIDAHPNIHTLDDDDFNILFHTIYKHHRDKPSIIRGSNLAVAAKIFFNRSKVFKPDQMIFDLAMYKIVHWNGKANSKNWAVIFYFITDSWNNNLVKVNLEHEFSQLSGQFLDETTEAIMKHHYQPEKTVTLFLHDNISTINNNTFCGLYNQVALEVIKKDNFYLFNAKQVDDVIKVYMNKGNKFTPEQLILFLFHPKAYQLDNRIFGGLLFSILMLKNKNLVLRSLLFFSQKIGEKINECIEQNNLKPFQNSFDQLSSSKFDNWVNIFNIELINNDNDWIDILNVNNAIVKLQLINIIKIKFDLLSQKSLCFIIENLLIKRDFSENEILLLLNHHALDNKNFSILYNKLAQIFIPNVDDFYSLQGKRLSVIVADKLRGELSDNCCRFLANHPQLNTMDADISAKLNERMGNVNGKLIVKKQHKARIYSEVE